MFIHVIIFLIIFIKYQHINMKTQLISSDYTLADFFHNILIKNNAFKINVVYRLL